MIVLKLILVKKMLSDVVSNVIIFKNKIKLNKDNKENFYSYWTLYVVVYINQNYKIVQQHFFG